MPAVPVAFRVLPAARATVSVITFVVPALVGTVPVPVPTAFHRARAGFAVAPAIRTPARAAVPSRDISATGSADAVRQVDRRALAGVLVDSGVGQRDLAGERAAAGGRHG